MKLFLCSICFLPLTLLSQLSGSLSSDVFMCAGDGGYTITFTGANGTMPYTFTYNINGGSPQTVTTVVGNSVSLSIPTNVAGLFNYQLTLVEDDFGTSQVVFDQANATVNPLPIVGAGPDQSVCPGYTVTLTGTGAATYTWNNSVTNGVGFVPISTSTYTVTGTSAYGCINTDQVVVTVDCSSLDEQNQIIAKLSPNPTSSILTIEGESIIETISIYTLNGHLVKYGTPLSQKSVIDLSDLTQGVYLVELNSEKGRIVKRIIVE